MEKNNVEKIEKTIYQRLIDVRVELQNLQLKKSGKNQSINYYELGDFVPAINELCAKYNLLPVFSILKDELGEVAVLRIIDTLKPDIHVRFAVPTAEVQLPRGQEIQNLGAKVTYLRRYMHMIAFEIVESDLVDSIKRDLTDEISEQDLNSIQKVKSIDELNKLYLELSKVYKIKLLIPIFKEAKEKINQDQSVSENLKELKK